MKYFLSRDDVVRSINPHLLSILRIDSRHVVEKIPSIKLLSPKRFDVAAKELYVRLRKFGTSSWPETVYREHLRVWGGFNEGDGSGKSSFEDYRSHFEALIESMSNNGFEEEKGLVPIGNGNLIIDGAHRLGIALAFGHDVSVVRFPIVPNYYDSEYFMRRGLRADVADAMTLEYCRLSKCSRIAVIFPVAKGQEVHIEKLLQKCGPILYRKSVVFSRNGRGNLIRTLYRGESWIGDGLHESPGLRYHIENRFISGRAVNFIFFENKNESAIADVKAEIRDLFKLGNDSIHINDHHHQTIDLAEQVLNRNSIHFMNHARVSSFPKFYKLFLKLKTWMDRNGIDRERLCVDGSAVLAAYGLREVNDLDFLFCGDAAPSTGDELLSCHNDEALHYKDTIDEIVIDPANHFWYMGVKFVALTVVREMKQRRNEAKDRRDLVRIDSIQDGGRTLAFGLKLYTSMPEVFYSMRHRFVSNFKKIVPKRLKPLAKAIYDLPLLIRELMGPEEKRITYRGFELCYSRGTSLIRMIKNGEMYEQRLSAYVVEWLKMNNDGLFIDIGANIGLISLNVLHELPEIKIWAFEPGPHQANLFKETIVLNNLSEYVDLKQIALSNEIGTAEFCIHSTRHASGDGFMDTNRAGSASTVIVDIDKLDRIWTENGVPNVSLIKIDTEGAELLVLEGAQKLLRESKPIVVFELDARNIKPYPYKPEDIVEFFERHDYRVKEISGEEVTSENVRAAMMKTGDFVAIPESRASKQL